MATLAMRAVGSSLLARARAEPISSRAGRPRAARVRAGCLNRAGAKSIQVLPRRVERLGARHPRGWTCAARSTVAASDANAEDDDEAGDSAGAVKKYEGSAELATQLEAAGDAVAEYLNEALKTWEPPKFLWRTLYTLLLLGLVVKRVLWQRKLNMQQTLQQIARVGPDTLGVAMLTSSFVGMVFTIQFCKEFSKVGLTRVIGGLLGLAFTRELTPVICAIVLAGRVGSAIAAELGTMQVSEQVDQLRTLGSDPVDYLVAPRVVACAVSLPILSLVSFSIGMAASILLADLRYGISPNAIIDSAAKYLESGDIGIMSFKALAFGAVIATISCGWGQTTTGGAKGVGESTTASVVISLVAIFVVDFFISLTWFQR
jgi:ABC transport permease subunit